MIIVLLDNDIDDAENHTSESHGPRTLLMAPAQQEEENDPRRGHRCGTGQMLSED